MALMPGLLAAGTDPFANLPGAAEAAPAAEEKKQSEDGGSVAAPALATAAPGPTAGVGTESNGVDPML